MAGSKTLRDAAAERVAFRLERDADGYPPADWEHLWVRESGTGEFTVDNTPFFVRGISFGDVISADRRNGELVFAKLLRPSRHSTLRVIVFDKTIVPEIRLSLRDLKCASELSHVSGLIAVDCPPEASIDDVRGFLEQGEEAGRWEYEEAAIRH